MGMGTVGVVVATALLAFTVGCGEEMKSEGHSGGAKMEGMAGSVDTAAAEKIAQKTCPVGKNKIDPKVFVEHVGRKIYFCCPGCDKVFQQDPAKYVKLVDEEIAQGGS